MRSRRLRCWAVGVAAGVALAGCSGGAHVSEDLSQALRQTRAAVRTGELALDLLDGGVLTPAAASTAVDDMGREAAKAQRQLANVRTDSVADRDRRATAMTAVQDAVLALLDTQDALDAKAAPGPLRSRLGEADRELEQALQAVGGS